MPAETSPTDSGPTEIDAVRNEIEQTRSELADTVDALSDKLNVRKQAVDHRAQLAAVGGALVAGALLLHSWSGARQGPTSGRRMNRQRRRCRP